MKVLFKTNIDNYKTNCWPILAMPPRKGESVSVVKVFEKYYSDKKLPTKLEVVDVTWHEEVVLCELWYRNIDIESAKASGTNLF